MFNFLYQEMHPGLLSKPCIWLFSPCSPHDLHVTRLRAGKWRDCWCQIDHK